MLPSASKGLPYNRKIELDLVAIGSISIVSQVQQSYVAQSGLPRLETRKVVFDGARLLDDNLADSLLDAVHIGILWLINKSDYCGVLHQEAKARIAQPEKRWNVLQREIVF